MVNGIVSLISVSDFSLLVYRNARDFCVLTLYGRWILNHWTTREVLACLSLGVKLSELWHMANSSDHHHDQEQATSITLKMPRAATFWFLLPHLNSWQKDLSAFTTFCPLQFSNSLCILNIRPFSYLWFTNIFPLITIASLFITGDMSDEIYFSSPPSELKVMDPANAHEILQKWKWILLSAHLSLR